MQQHTTIRKDIDKRGHTVYHTWGRRAGRWIRMNKSEAELTLAADTVEVIHGPNPYQPYAKFVSMGQTPNGHSISKIVIEVK